MNYINIPAATQRPSSAPSPPEHKVAVSGAACQFSAANPLNCKIIYPSASWEMNSSYFEMSKLGAASPKTPPEDEPRAKAKINHRRAIRTEEETQRQTKTGVFGEDGELNPGLWCVFSVSARADEFMSIRNRDLWGSSESENRPDPRGNSVYHYWQSAETLCRKHFDSNKFRQSFLQQRIKDVNVFMSRVLSLAASSTVESDSDTEDFQTACCSFTVTVPIQSRVLGHVKK